MRFLQWLIGRAPGPETTAEEITANGEPARDALPAIIKADRAEDSLLLVNVPPTAGGRGDWQTGDLSYDLESFFCAIEYEAADGAFTRRRITMQKCYQGPQGALISAICHERRALRTFRVSRIRGLIDTDGEIHDARSYLTTAFGIDFDNLNATPDDAVTARARQLRETLHPELTLLVATARADSEFHISELDRIELFVESEVVHLVRANILPDVFGIAELDRLRPIIHAMRPQKASLKGAAHVIAGYDDARVNRLKKALAGVMHADGRIMPKEEAMIASFHRDLEEIDAEWRDNALPQDLRDVTICFTGRMQTMSRSAAEALVRNLGATVKRHAEWTPYKGRNFVVSGNDPGSKADKARAMGVTVITEDEFLRMIGMG